MPELPETRETLLARLGDQGDREAWEQFSELYAPVIYRLARGRGLQDADAQDLTQKVLMAVAAAIPRWRSEGRGRFRHWLRRVTKHATINALTRGPRELAAGGSSAANLLREYPDADPAIGAEVDWESRRELFRRAAAVVRREVQPDTWEAFFRTVVEGESSQDVARQTGRSVGAIYVAKCRIVKRLQQIVRQFENEEET